MYLYRCNLSDLDNKTVIETKYLTEKNFRWFIVWFVTSSICLGVAATTFRSKNLKKVHPS